MTDEMRIFIEQRKREQRKWFERIKKQHQEYIINLIALSERLKEERRMRLEYMKEQQRQRRLQLIEEMSR